MKRQTTPMKRQTKNWILLLSLLIILVVFAVLFEMADSDKKEWIDRSAALEEELMVRDSTYDQVIDILYAVEEQIDNIKYREKLVSMTSEDGLTENKKRGLVSDMRSIDSLIVTTNETVGRLLAQLDNAQMDLKSFKNRVYHLSKELEERKAEYEVLRNDLKSKDMEIAKMTFTVQNLEDKVLDHERMIDNQLTEIAIREEKLNTAFLTIDSKKSLIENGVVVKEGGFLWFGKNLSLRDDAPAEKFSMIDIRNTSRLIVDAKDVELITDHPSDSYQIIREGDLIKHIDITDPGNFWRISKYLVLAVEG